MRRDEAIAILRLPTDQAVDAILALAERAETYDQLCDKVSPNTPFRDNIHVFKATPGETSKTARNVERP